jgi:hypothetical protein
MAEQTNILTRDSFEKLFAIILDFHTCKCEHRGASKKELIKAVEELGGKVISEYKWRKHYVHHKIVPGNYRGFQENGKRYFEGENLLILK